MVFLRFMLQDFDTAIGTIKAALETLLQRTDQDIENDNDSDDGQDQAGNGEEGAPKEDEIARPPNVNDGSLLPSLSRSLEDLH